MKKFQFRLEPVLEQRCQKEQQAVLHQSRAEQLYQERLSALEKSHRSLNNCLDTGVDTNPAGEMHRLLYQNHLTMQIHHQSHLAKQAKEKLEQACQKTVQARQERQVLEKLKEKKWEQYHHHLRKLEAKQTDEIATAIYNHHRNIN